MPSFPPCPTNAECYYSLGSYSVKSFNPAVGVDANYAAIWMFLFGAVAATIIVVALAMVAHKNG